ncbi:MAG: S-layer homology domain-containing protein [Eubacterium sp.]|nr:S-layer homology domain-containing protein [Eubacterium sp.]
MNKSTLFKMGFLFSFFMILFICMPAKAAEKETYHITVYANGGSFKDGSDKVEFDLEKGRYIGYAGVIGIEYIPTRDGYGRSGWYIQETDKTLSDGEELYGYVPYRDLTITVNWKRYREVEFDLAGGSIAKYSSDGGTIATKDSFSLTVFDGETVTTSYYSINYPYDFSAVLKDNYQLLGWYIKGCPDTVYQLYEIPITSDMTLVAKWGTEKEKYILSFDANGGWIDSEHTGNAIIHESQKGKSLGEQGIEVPYPDRKGYMFLGWKDRDTGEDFLYDGSIVISRDTYLVAEWVESVKLTFDANGGRFTGEDGNSSFNTVEIRRVSIGYTIEQDDEIYLPHIENGSCSLAGWLVGNQFYSSLAGFTARTDTVFKAVWQGGTPGDYYDITFDANGGKFIYSDATQETIRIEKGKPIGYNISVSAYKAGYDYDEYYDKTSGEKISRYDLYELVPNRNMTLSVVWVKPITVRFNYQGGTYRDIYTVDGSTIVEYHENSYELKTLPRSTLWNLPILNENAALAGWVVSGDSSGNLIGDLEDYTVTEDTVLNAVWKDGYKVTLEGNGGLFGYSNSISFRVVKGEAIKSCYFTMLEYPDGFLLNGWIDKKTNEYVEDSSGEITPESDITLYAEWIKGCYIMLDSNGGEIFECGESLGDVSEVNIIVFNGEAIPCDYNGYSFKREGKALLGWTENPYNYNASDIIDIKGMKPHKDMYLWAVWEDKDKVFKDVPKGSTGIEEIIEAYERGVVGGYGTIGNLSYKPNKSVTRAQFAIMLYKLGVYNGWIDENEPVNGRGFSDMTPSDSGYKEVMWAENHGVISGYASGKFKPSNPITRAQLTVMLQRFGELYGVDVTSGSKSISGFSDSSLVSDSFRSSLEWAYGQSILSGKKKNGQNVLDPNGQASRAQCAMFVMRFQHKIK